MPTFRPPHSVIDIRNPEKGIEQLRDNLEELIRDYNRVLQELDAEVFYHIIPIKTGEAPTAVGTFTASHKIIVVINNVEYYVQLDAV